MSYEEIIQEATSLKQKRNILIYHHVPCTETHALDEETGETHEIETLDLIEFLGY